MSDRTNDTDSEISQNSEKLYKPGSTPGASGGGPSGSVNVGPVAINTGGGGPEGGDAGQDELVEIGKHDISNQSKKTLGDFMSRVTQGKAGSAGKPNAFTVDPTLSHFKLTDPSTGLPAPHGNAQENVGSASQLKQAGTTLGSFISTVDPDAQAIFDSLSTGYFNGAETTSAGLATKEDKNSQTFGHTIMSDIEGVDSPSVRLGAPAIFEPKGSLIQQNISAVLETNRFNPTPYTPFMQDNETKELGFTKQTTLGTYERNQPLVEFDEIKKVGHQMTIAATGHSPLINSKTVASFLPTLEQITGTQTLSSQDFRPRSMPAAETVTIDKGELVQGESDHSSYGHLNSPLEPFSQSLPVGMFVNAVSGMASLILSATALSALLDLIKPEGSGSSIIRPAEPFSLKKGRHANIKSSSGGMLWSMLDIPRIEYSFMECMHLGILVFYGVDEIPEALTGDDIDLEKMVNSARIVAQSPGYYNSVNRAVLRDAENIAEEVSSIPAAGPDSLLQIFQVVETLTSSSTWRFFMQMAELGNQMRMAVDGHPRLAEGDVDLYKENAVTRVKMSRANPKSAEGAFYPGSQSPARLAWRHSSSPSRYLLPQSFIRAQQNINAKPADYLNVDLHMAMNGYPTPEDTFDGGKSNLGEGAKYIYDEDDGISTYNRLSKEYVQFIENGLEAEYMPFYFHDLRTNEIISFHAFLGGYTDGFSTDYTSTSGYGRSDDVKIYNKTTRAISFDFTVAATSVQDLDVMYWNINKLVSMCYPQWSRGRQMTNGDNDRFIQPFSQIPTASPMIRVRIGDMLRSNYSKFGLQRIFGLREI